MFDFFNLGILKYKSVVFSFLSKIVFAILVPILITYFLQKIINKFVDNYFKKIGNIKGDNFSSLFRNVFNIVLWVVCFVVIVSRLGYNISTLVAGIGISGIAVALAIQPTLAGIFAGLFIFIDKPFKVGDMVVIGKFTGVVKEIGIRNTIVTATDGGEVILQNTQIMSNGVENISQSNHIRQDSVLGLVYSTDSKKLQKAIDLVKNILLSKEHIYDEDIRVYFKNFGDFSLNVAVTYFITNDLTAIERGDLISSINFDIKKSFEKNNICFAYPTQTIYSIKS